MLKTISPIDNSVYLERPYASSSEIENVLEQSNQSKIVWKNTSLVERKELVSRFVDSFKVIIKFHSILRNRSHSILNNKICRSLYLYLRYLKFGKFY